MGHARIGVLVANRRDLVGDHAAELRVARQDRLELGDRFAELRHLVLELAATKSGEPAERHVQDVIGLLLGELERGCHQRDPRSATVVGSANRRDHEVQHVDGLEEAFDDVGSGLRLAQTELCPARHDLHLVGDVVRQCLRKVQGARNPIDEGQHVHRERRLQ